MFERFQEWYDRRHDYARAWKDKDAGKVVGYFCTYVPEEIFYAAGVLPVRVLGSHEPQDVTEPHIFGMFCPFCRDVLAQGLKGRYDYLDGITIAQSCLHIRQSFTSWQKHVPVEYSYYLCMPHHVQSPRAHPFLTAELEELRKSVEGWTRAKIGDGELDEAIEVYNESRRLLRRFNDLRKGPNPPVSGEEAMLVSITNQMVDKRDHSVVLEDLLRRLPGRSVGNGTKKRLMILGSENDDLPFVRMVESLNAVIVADDHCTGTRYYWNPVEPRDNRLEAIAARYIERPACPTKDWPERTRVPHVLNLARDHRVDGAIIIQQKFCDPHECDIPAIKKAMEEAGFPCLFLEFDVTVPIGQFRIRVEA
ncbi:MAG: benzoyl-CoA reductase, bzd-type, subunit N, partial [Candidatus Glassbacteria bacterium RBG_16_58_8]